MQFRKSKEKLEKELAVKIDMLAWPFGIYDDELIAIAVRSGYTAAFTIERRPAGLSENITTLPRFLMVDTDRGKRFETILAAGMSGGK
jgi:hypothetical protein